MRTNSGTKVARRAASVSHPQISGSREGEADEVSRLELRGRTVDIASAHLRLPGPGGCQPTRSTRTGDSTSAFSAVANTGEGAERRSYPRTRTTLRGSGPAGKINPSY